MEMVDGKKDSGEDDGEEHDTGREVSREGRGGKSQLTENTSSTHVFISVESRHSPVRQVWLP